MTTVGSGTTLTISSGQTIDGVIVLKGGLLHVLSGGTIRNTLNSTGYDLIESGGNAIDTIVTGTISLLSVGWGIEPGTEYVLSGGTATGAALHAGSQQVYGSALDTTVGWGSIQWVFSGGTATGTVLSGGVETFSGVPLLSSGTQEVFAGGTAIDTIVNSGGELSVQGAAIGAILDGGFGGIGYGGNATGTTINAGGRLGVNGTATATTINSGGVLSVDDRGTSIDTRINNGGLAIANAGSVQGTTAIDNGVLELHSAVVATGLIAFIGNSGTLKFDDPVALGAVIYEFDAFDRIKFAADHLDAGDNPLFKNGGALTTGPDSVLHVLENGITYDLQFDPLQGFSGKAFELVPNYDGVDLVIGNVSNVPFGQTLSSNQVGSSNIQNVFGAATGTTIGGGGYQNVEPGGSTTETIIQAGAVQEVLGGGVDIGATVVGGNQTVLLGGEAIDATINGGVQTVYGTSHQTTVNSGRLLVYSGGSAIDTTLNNGGFEYVQYGGTATGTIVNSGGFLGTDGGGAMVGVTINSGGIANVQSSTISDPTINDGTLVLHNDSAVAGAIHFAGTGGTLEFIDADPTITTAQFDGSVLTVNTVDATLQFQIDGATGATFTEQPGVFGGTDIIFALPTNHSPVVSHAITSTKSEDDPAYFLDLLQFASDPDANDVLHVANVTGLVAGVTLKNDTLYVDPNAYNSLAVGEHASITVNYNVVDGNGGSVPQTAMVTIDGKNDSPIGRSSVATVHDRLTLSMPPIVDPDIHDTLKVVSANFGKRIIPISAGTFTVIDGKYGELFLYDDGSYTYLADPDHHASPPKNGAQEAFSYTVSDGHGATAQSTLTVTVTPSVASGVSPSEVGYPIWNTDGTGFEALTQGSRSDPFVFVKNSDPSIIKYDQKGTPQGFHHENDHLEGTHYQWAYDFQPPGSKDASISIPIHAVSTGTVVFVQDSLTGNFAGYGNVVTILSQAADGNPYYVTYAHLRPNDVNTSHLRIGDAVSVGDVIGDLGQSGTFDGATSHAHLHIQFGSSAYEASLVTTGYQSGYGNLSSPAIVADGLSDQSNSPAYFPELTMRYDHGPNTNDRVFNGAQGKDIFYANGLGDTIYGAGGSDALFAGAGKDTFLFKATTDSQLGEGNFDTIFNFQPGQDHIDFSAIAGITRDATLVTNPAQVVAHGISYYQTGADTVIIADASKMTNHVDMMITLVGVNSHTLSSSDFFHV
ncbi:AIDA repeat-containing protein [Bradyrhizobium diazoefficiens]|nr:AIDA repeat-containing protein [Bradyrhizobium diazoefficiens]BCE62385.1 hypothetical protein XF6B_11840 [Bradyrhizobium diazoefficiens]